jgi:hypothetical protein
MRCGVEVVTRSKAAELKDLEAGQRRWSCHCEIRVYEL